MPFTPPQQPCEEERIVIPILQRKKLRCSEVKCFAWRHTAKERLSCDLKPDSLTYLLILSALHLQTPFSSP